MKMAWQGQNKFEMMNPEDIRSEPKSYPELIIRTLNRLVTVASTQVSKDVISEWRGLETAIRFTHAITKPYHTIEYEKKVKVIEEKINFQRSQDTNIYTKNYSYIIHLQKWVEAIAELLPEMDILSAKKVAWIAGKGQYKGPEDLIIEEED